MSYSVIPETQLPSNNDQQRTSVRCKAEPDSPDSSPVHDSLQLREKPKIKRQKYSQRECCIPGRTLPTPFQQKHLPGPVQGYTASLQTESNEKDVPLNQQCLRPEPVECYGSSSESESNEENAESDVDVTGMSNISEEMLSKNTSSSDDQEDTIRKITKKALQPLSDISSISSESNENEVATVTER